MSEISDFKKMNNGYATPNPESAEDEVEIDLKAYLRIMRKRIWVIVGVFVFILVTAAAITMKTRPMYKASTRILINKENPNVISFEEVLQLDSKSTEYYETQYKIIKSRNLITKVIETLDLKNSTEFLPDDADDKNNLKTRVLEIVIGFWEDVLDIAGKEKDESLEIAIDSEAYENERLYQLFLTRLAIKPILKSRLVDLEISGYNPRIITKITNTLASRYIEQNLENRLYASEDAAIWLDERLKGLQVKVETSERALQSYSRQIGIVSIEDKRKSLDQQLDELNSDVIKAKSKRIKLQTLYKNTQDPKFAKSLPQIIENRLIQTLHEKLANLNDVQSKLGEKYGIKHPRMLQISSQIAKIQEMIDIEVKKIHESIYTQYQLALIDERSLIEALETQQEEASFVNEKSIGYGVLKREADSNRQMYDILLKRLKETDMSQGLRTNNIRVIDKAVPPLEPYKPKKKLNLLLGVVLGLFGGIGLAFLIEYLDNTVKEPDEIAIRFGIPFLGLVGNYDGVLQSKEKNSTDIELITLRDPSSNVSESLRTIRTNVIFSADGDKEKTFMVTSALPGEGKTSVASNLAVVMASLGERVLLIDADLRRPSIHKVFRINKIPGLSSYLIRQKEINEIIVESGIDNLSIIPCGITPPNPSELLSHPQMPALIEYARNSYDRVIIDTPPVASVTDPIIISRQAHAVLFVIRCGVAPRDAVSKSIQQLIQVQANILGAVLNAVDFRKDSYYYQYYYKHYYYKEEKSA